MAFEIPADLNPRLMGLAWMIGSWQGTGEGTSPDRGDFTFGQRIDVTTNSGPFLHYVWQAYNLSEDGQPVSPLMMETGFWRPQDDASVELVLANPEGWAEVWAGKIEGGKIELVTDAVMRTTSADIEYTGGQRLYGNVNGELMWTFDRATATTPLQPFIWSRLTRI